jgi:DNA polymerase III epsilon subunit-like protein
VTPNDRPIVFIDTETTGLNPDRHEVWELAIITRRSGQTDTERVYQVRPDLVIADDEALKINRFHDRFKVPDDARAALMLGDHAQRIELSTLRQNLMQTMAGAVLVGSNTQFDATFTRKLLGNPDESPWHYRPVNALELAAGWLLGRGEEVPVPWSSAEISRRVGVHPPSKHTSHTALPDARWARDVFDVVTGAMPVF